MAAAVVDLIHDDAIVIHHKRVIYSSNRVESSADVRWTGNPRTVVEFAGRILILGDSTMKKLRKSDSQIMAILKQAESGVPIVELCLEYGMRIECIGKWQADPFNIAL